MRQGWGSRDLWRVSPSGESCQRPREGGSRRDGTGKNVIEGKVWRRPHGGGGEWGCAVGLVGLGSEKWSFLEIRGYVSVAWIRRGLRALVGGEKRLNS